MRFSTRYLPCHKVKEGGHGQNETRGPLWKAWYLDSSDGHLRFGSLVGVWLWPQGMLFVVLVSRNLVGNPVARSPSKRIGNFGLQAWL